MILLIVLIAFIAFNCTDGIDKLATGLQIASMVEMVIELLYFMFA